MSKKIRVTGRCLSGIFVRYPRNNAIFGISGSKTLVGCIRIIAEDHFKALNCGKYKINTDFQHQDGSLSVHIPRRQQKQLIWWNLQKQIFPESAYPQKGARAADVLKLAKIRLFELQENGFRDFVHATPETTPYLESAAPGLFGVLIYLPMETDLPLGIAKTPSKVWKSMILGHLTMDATIWVGFPRNGPPGGAPYRRAALFICRHFPGTGPPFSTLQL